MSLQLPFAFTTPGLQTYSPGFFLQIYIYLINIDRDTLPASGSLVMSKNGQIPCLHRTCTPAEEREIDQVIARNKNVKLLLC